MAATFDDHWHLLHCQLQSMGGTMNTLYFVTLLQVGYNLKTESKRQMVSSLALSMPQIHFKFMHV